MPTRRFATGVLLLALSACAPAPGAPPSGLRIASWNIAWLHRSLGLGEIPRSEADYARLRAYAAKLDADVVALQEIDGEEAARRVFDPAVYAFHFTSDRDNRQRTGFAFRRGLRVTRHPDVRSLAIEGSRRGADLDVESDGVKIRLLSIHLKAQCADRPLDSGDPACSTLARQLPALERWIDARASEGSAFAVLGDFNRRFDSADGFWKDLDDGEPDDADLVDAGAGRRPRCWGRAHGDLIDHIVLGRKAALRLVPDSFEQLDYAPEDASRRATLSDHCPIRVELSATPMAPRAPISIEASEAATHVGERLKVCGKVASTRWLDTAPDRPTFLNLARPHPDQALTVVIRGTDRPRFGRPEETFAGRRICVTGRIESYRGRPQIVATDPTQVELVE